MTGSRRIPWARALVLCLVATVTATMTVPRHGWAQSPATFACSGNEPFWALRIDGNRAEYSQPSGEGVEQTPLAGVLTPVDVVPEGTVVWRGRGEGMTSDLVAYLLEQECHDSMSGERHTHRAYISLPDGDVRIGCCSVETKKADAAAFR